MLVETESERQVLQFAFRHYELNVLDLVSIQVRLRRLQGRAGAAARANRTLRHYHQEPQQAVRHGACRGGAEREPDHLFVATTTDVHICEVMFDFVGCERLSS